MQKKILIVAAFAVALAACSKKEEPKAPVTPPAPEMKKEEMKKDEPKAEEKKEEMKKDEAKAEEKKDGAAAPAEASKMSDVVKGAATGAAEGGKTGGTSGAATGAVKGAQDAMKK